MALIENCRNEIFEFNGLNLLVDFLFESPGDYEISETELNACERVLIKLKSKFLDQISKYNKQKYILI
jgi:hypothetical protein